MKNCIVLVLLLLSVKTNANNFFVGYDFGEMAFNDFKNFSGEIGYKFESGKSIEIFYMDVVASEKHLSSDFAQAVDGNNVSGVFKGYEIFYNLPFSSGWYFAPSLGYFTEKYQHTYLQESVSSTSPTVGVAIGYKEENLFGLKNLYYDFSFPFRYSFNSFEDTKLGDSTVKNNAIRNNLRFVVGLSF
jgi:hypothetical protein